MKPRRLYALSSGMMTEKTLSNIFARQILSAPEHGLFFIGYADPHSPAGKIRHAESGDIVELSHDLAPQALHCRMEKFKTKADLRRSSKHSD